MEDQLNRSDCLYIVRHVIALFAQLPFHLVQQHLRRRRKHLIFLPDDIQSCLQPGKQRPEAQRALPAGVHQLIKGQHITQTLPGNLLLAMPACAAGADHFALTDEELARINALDRNEKYLVLKTTFLCVTD